VSKQLKDFDSTVIQEHSESAKAPPKPQIPQNSYYGNDKNSRIRIVIWISTKMEMRHPTPQKYFIRICRQLLVNLRQQNTPNFPYPMVKILSKIPTSG